MCGFTGFLDLSGTRSQETQTDLLQRMTHTLRHRGPDDQGLYLDAEHGVGLGHRRLSILDLSPAGHQPMISRTGRMIIAYNGEVFNFQEIRRELEALGHAFRGGSDTEVILAACETFGVPATAQRLIGMFAFALWDRQERTLTLVRDRVGIKPLYWGRFGSLFLFGSELKALRGHNGWQPRLNRDAAVSFLRLCYVPNPLSIYQGIEKLTPGSILTIGPDGHTSHATYWSLAQVAEEGKRTPFTGSDQEAVDALETLLTDAVGRRLVSDVPLGAFLSGGIDSSLVVALMARQSATRVKTFTIGFGEADYNEADHARAVARHLGTDHTELMVTPEDALALIPRLPEIYDEPFADPSQIPTHLVSQLTRRHVTVALSGDGGDELFAGYNRYIQGLRVAPISRLPVAPRQLLATLIHAVSPDAWDRAAALLPARLRPPPQVGDKLHKWADVLPKDFHGFYERLISQWMAPGELVPGSLEPPLLHRDPQVIAAFPGIVERMQYVDFLTYLPEDILTKVDRASMDVSLEARVPLLDHRVAALAWRLPMHLKLRGGTRKWILRQVLHRHVPAALVERPKMGFAVPIHQWLRGPLADWADGLLEEKRLRQGEWLNPAPIRQKWEEHRAGKRNWQYALWNVLMLQAWLRQNPEVTP